MNISISKIIELREKRDYESIAKEKEKYSCEVSGAEYNERFFEARNSRPIEFDIIEPLPPEKQMNARFILAILCGLSEEKLFQTFSGDLKCDSGKTFEEEFGVNFIK